MTAWKNRNKSQKCSSTFGKHDKPVRKMENVINLRWGRKKILLD